MADGHAYVIKAGDTFPDLIEQMGNFEDWIISGTGLAPERVRVVNAEAGEALPDPETVRGAVISGSHSMVTQGLAWSLALEDWARQMIAAKVPLLGICYGHQIMARAMGGRVDFHPGERRSARHRSAAMMPSGGIRCFGTCPTPSRSMFFIPSLSWSCLKAPCCWPATILIPTSLSE